MTSAGLNKMLRRMAKAAGLDKDVWTYLIRHTRATRLYEELPQQIVEKLLGHKNQAQIYAHISMKKARDEMLNKIYKIEELPQAERQKLEKEMEKMRKQVSVMQNQFAKFMEDVRQGRVTTDEGILAIEPREPDYLGIKYPPEQKNQGIAFRKKKR